MKKTYISPETIVVRLEMQGGLLIGSLNGGEAGAPELFDDPSEQLEIPGLSEFQELFLL